MPLSQPPWLTGAPCPGVTPGPAAEPVTGKVSIRPAMRTSAVSASVTAIRCTTPLYGPAIRDAKTASATALTSPKLLGGGMSSMALTWAFTSSVAKSSGYMLTSANVIMVSVIVADFLYRKTMPTSVFSQVRIEISTQSYSNFGLARHPEPGRLAGAQPGSSRQRRASTSGAASITPYATPLTTSCTWLCHDSPANPGPASSM